MRVWDMGNHASLQRYAGSLLCREQYTTYAKEVLGPVIQGRVPRASVITVDCCAQCRPIVAALVIETVAFLTVAIVLAWSLKYGGGFLKSPEGNQKMQPNGIYQGLSAWPKALLFRLSLSCIPAAQCGRLRREGSISSLWWLSFVGPLPTFPACPFLCL